MKNHSSSSSAPSSPSAPTPAATNHEYCETAAGRWVAVVKEYVRRLDYGEIVIRVHSGRVVQVHKTEKIQFP